MGWNSWLITEPSQTRVNTVNRFKVNTAVNMKIKIRLKVPPYTLVDRHQSSKQPVCLYLQGREIEAEDSLQKVSSF